MRLPSQVKSLLLPVPIAANRLALVEQALFSASSFLVPLALVARENLEQLGVFTLASTCWIASAAASRALIGEPTLLKQSPYSPVRLALALAMVSSVAVFGALLLVWPDLAGPVAVGVFASVLLDAQRSVLRKTDQMHAATVYGLFRFSVMAVGAYLVFMKQGPVLYSILVYLIGTATYVVAGLHKFASNPLESRPWRQTFSSYWRLSRVLGVESFIVTGVAVGTYWVIDWGFGPEALGSVRAAQLLLAPTVVATAAIPFMLAGGRPGVKRRLNPSVRLAAGLGMLTLGWGLVVGLPSLAGFSFFAAIQIQVLLPVTLLTSVSAVAACLAFGIKMMGGIRFVVLVRMCFAVANLIVLIVAAAFLELAGALLVWLVVLVAQTFLLWIGLGAKYRDQSVEPA